MKCWKSYLIDIPATGFLTLLLFSTVLFWAGATCRSYTTNRLLTSDREISYGLIQLEIENILDIIEDRPHKAACRFALENLQPPVLALSSYFTASRPEIYRRSKLFIQPDSSVAMLARKSNLNIIADLSLSLLIISPSIILSILLAVLLRKDAVAVGLSKHTKLYWTIGTIAFGLSAYITYRLTKPKITLVTCANCGRLRRPDMIACHRCGSKWHVAELTPPSWRVIDRQAS